MFKELKDYDNAILNIEQAIKINSDYFVSYFNLGNIYKELKDYNKAILSLNKAIELKPDRFESYNNLANTYQELQDYDNSIINFNKAIELKPDKFEPYNELGNIYQVLQDYDKSILNFNKAIELKPNRFELYNNLANTYQALQDYDNSIINLNKAIELNSNRFEMYNNLGYTYKVLQDYDKAIINFKKAIELNGDQFEPYNNLANTYQDIKDYDNAILNYNKAIKLDPDSFEIHCHMSYVYQQLKDYDNAILHNQVIIECVKDNIVFLNIVILHHNTLINLKIDNEYIEENLSNDETNFKKVESMQEFYTEIKRIKEQDLKPNLVFRGYNRISWELIPLLYRTPLSENENNITRMKNFLERFKIQAPARTHLNFKDYNNLDYMGIMQHYGTPTPLLDWTISTEIALFFSLYIDKNTEKDNVGIPCVAVLAYKNFTSEDKMKVIIDKVLKDDDENKVNEEKVNQNKVNIFMPSRLHSRTDSQYSVFSYHESKIENSSEFTSFDDHNDHNDDKFTIYKIALMPQAIREIQDMLELHQITPDVIYQDLQKLGERISSQNYNYGYGVLNEKIIKPNININMDTTTSITSPPLRQ